MPNHVRRRDATKYGPGFPVIGAGVCVAFTAAAMYAGCGGGSTGTGGGGGASSGSSTTTSSTTGTGGSLPAPPCGVFAAEAGFPEPPVYCASNHTLKVEMTAMPMSPSPQPVGGQTIYTDGYQATKVNDVAVANPAPIYPGPTMWLNVPAPGAPVTENGDVLRWTIKNGGGLNVCCANMAPPIPPFCANPPATGCVRVDGATNIHAHGFHTSGGFGLQDACTSTPKLNNPFRDSIFVGIVAPGVSAQNGGCSGVHCAANNAEDFIYPLPPQKAPDPPFQPSAIAPPHWYGLQWYHPHADMTSQEQVNNGLAGAIVIHNLVEDTIPVFMDIKDRLLIFQYMLQNPHVNPPPALVNGQVVLTGVPGDGGTILVATPLVITMQPGELQRFRILDASSDQQMLVSLVDPSTTPPNAPQKIYPIGYDGVPLPVVGDGSASGASSTAGYPMGPGNRLEFLFQAPLTPGATYQIQWCNFTDGDTKFGDCTGATIVAVKISVGTTPVSPVPPSPAKLPLVKVSEFGLIDDLSAIPAAQVTKQTVKFFTNSSSTMWSLGDGSMDAGVPFSELQGCKTTPQSQPFTMAMGTMAMPAVQEWTLENWTTGWHTFHMHVNPFQVMTVQYPGGAPKPFTTPPNLPYYQDTVLLPPGGGGDGGPLAVTPSSTVIRMNPVDYPGITVFHCHMLTDEDNGMMAAFSITPFGF